MNLALLDAAGAPAAHPGTGFWSGLSAGDVTTAAVTLLVGIIAALVAVRAYQAQQKESRRQDKAQFYAEAVRAVEDYMEGPYRILRKDGSAQARREITQHISDVKSRMSFYTGWMAIHGTPEVRAAYETFIAAAQREAGPQMTAAWEARPVKKDQDVPLRGQPLPRGATDMARTHLLAVLTADLDR